ncbi:MAG: aminodeoxychorismate synthase component I [Saprospiraceae bacterium]|nr:aminodeoxychorismate synthase component I [Saprospiraceae bacterium]
MIEKLAIEEQMNEWGAAGIPFLFVVDFEGFRSHVWQLAQLDRHSLQFQFRHLGNKIQEEVSLPESLIFDRQAVDFLQYQQAFRIAQQAIFEGNSYLLNLTFPTPIDTNLNLHQIFQYSTAPYQLWWKDHFVVFSPETFVKISNGQIASYPMKGTIDASLPAAEAQLLANYKEKAEHATIVDLIRNDLNLVAQKVRVERYRYVDEVETMAGRILQTSTKIVGELPADYEANLGTILRKLLPAGSITGAPKKKTVEVIRTAEPYKRGYYTGVMGVFDGQNLDSAVMIRFIEQEDQQLIFKSGGGITSQSNAMEEYQELIQKVYLPFVLANSTH